MSDVTIGAMDGRRVRDALSSIHAELAALAKAPALDPQLVAAADEALSKLRLSAAFCGDQVDEVTKRLRELREALVEALEAQPSGLRQRALLRAAAFVSGAICELRPSLV